MNLVLWILLSILVSWLIATKTKFGKPQNFQLETIIAVGGGLFVAYVLNYFGKATLMGLDLISDGLVMIGAAATLAGYRLLASLFDHVA